MKIKSIKPRVSMLASTAPTLQPTHRKRGEMLQKRNWAYLAAHPWCACGCGRLAQEIDHITPLYAGGVDGEPNLQGLTVECHKAKSAKEYTA